jgi:NitT/TauT family transport system substrate-binding protein
VSVQSRVLQYAAAKQWGDKEFNRLDKWTVAVPHPDAAAAIIAGGTEITGHFGNPPFQEQELAGNPNARIVLNSYDVLGGPSSATVLYATEKFRNDNPKTYRAFVDALAEAAQFATKNPEAAADLYIRVNKAKIDRALLVKILKNPQVQFKVTPQNTFALAEFMYRVGAIKHSRSRGRTISSRTRQPRRELTWPKAISAHLRVVASHEPLLQVDGVSLEYRTRSAWCAPRIA